MTTARSEIDALIDEFAAELASAEVVFGHGTNNARDEACRLVLDGLDFDTRAASAQRPLAANGRRSLTASERKRLDALLARRINERVPVPYLTGKAWLGGMAWDVLPGTMIPRSPIAEVLASRVEPWLAAEPRRILDLCCGVGALGVLAALAFPNARVDLADDDPAALALARGNARRAGDTVARRIDVVQTDLFAGLSGRYDVILCNPPYVPTVELAALPAEFQHEPRHGLDGGTDGLRVWRRIVAGLDAYLADAGVLVGEAGNLAEAFDAAFPQLGAVWLALERSERQAGDSFGVFATIPALRSVR